MIQNKYPWAVSIAAAIVILDQVTKYLVMHSIRMYETITVIPGFFNLTYVRNRGAAFGMLAGVPGIGRCVFFIAVTLIAVAVIIVLIRKTSERLLVSAFSLIAGGAMGNLIDRARWCDVVDFIDWYVRSYHWPTFNIADSAITVGVGLLVVDILFGTSTKSQAPNPK